MKKLCALVISAVLTLLLVFSVQPLASTTVYGEWNFEEQCQWCVCGDLCNCAHGCSGPNDPICACMGET